LPAFARFLACLCLAGLLGAGGAVAHSGGEPYIIVPVDHILPGQTFDVIAADMGPDAEVRFEISTEQRVVPLATATAGPDGHFQTTLSLPSDFPTGYAELLAVGNDGSRASTWVLVGLRTESTPAPPGASAWWTDPSVLLLGAFLMGALAVVGYLLLWPRSRTPPVAAPLPSRRQVRKKARARPSGD
jgi:hypothetical protein